MRSLNASRHIHALFTAPTGSKTTGDNMFTNPRYLGLAIAALAMIGFAFYPSCTSGNRLNVSPDAAEKIEKAKRR
jgi:hypothetical protein